MKHQETEDKRREIKYVTGDATCPVNATNDEDEIKFIIYICNDVDRRGKGFVMALSSKWPMLKEAYHTQGKMLGSSMLVTVEPNLHVANMIAQHGIYSSNGIPPIRYDALKSCLETIVSYVKSNFKDKKVSFHGPKMGTGLAGGEWSKIQPILEETLGDYPIYIYELV